MLYLGFGLQQFEWDSLRLPFKRVMIGLVIDTGSLIVRVRFGGFSTLGTCEKGTLDKYSILQMSEPEQDTLAL